MRYSFTPHTEAFASMFMNASEQDRTVLGQMHQHFEGEVRRIRDEGNEPHNIAYTINGIVDASVANTLKTKNGRKVQCRRGCASCCKLHVSITREEAALLLIAAEQEEIPIDWARVERQSEHNLATWKDQGPADQRCVFLDSRNECSVYEYRPTACRKYLVASDPKNCNTIKFPDAKVAIVAPVEGEAVVSAMLGILDWSSMPRMLLQAKEAAS